jgi:hypothetical protein
VPVGSETLVCGPYTATYGGVALGIFEGDGGLPTLEQQYAAEPVANTSAWGKVPIDDVYQGPTPSYAFTCLEYKAGPLAAFWPYHATLGRLGTIGVLMYSLASALVFTAVAGTSAAASPATQTLSKTVLMPGFSSRLVYGPTLRKVPLRFRVYPYDSGGNAIFFSQT